LHAGCALKSTTQKNQDKTIYKGKSALVDHFQVGSHQSKGGQLGGEKDRNSTNMSDGVHLFSFELLEAKGRTERVQT